MLALVGGSSTLASCAAHVTATASPPRWVATPSSLVDPLAGTGTGAVSPGRVGEFPGADVPFGMMQWSPDTTPDGVSGDGYSYTDSHISGFSLTHLSGSGCPTYEDVPVLPISGAIGVTPSHGDATYSHAHEAASPGRYSVTLGSGVGVVITVTMRTGLAQFTFPTTAAAHVLFKVGQSATYVTGSTVDVVSDDEVVGQVSSGRFCDTGTPYTLYFAATFDRAFAGQGTWSGNSLEAGSGHCQGSGCGAYVTFDASTDRIVKMKVGISYVSVAAARANLAAEDPGWSLPRVEAQATRRWDALLGRIRIGGGTHAEQRTFYTALYHSLLYPSLISDVDGSYTGDDSKVHYSARPQYSNFSEWDIYRCEIQLLSLVAPAQTGDMIQSLVDDARQSGWLPKWAIPDGDAFQMDGDSADPIIASAYAFGVRDFDVQGALSAMVKGATESAIVGGVEAERPYLGQYLAQHYVDAGVFDPTSIPYSMGGSATLDYAIDDFAIAQFAQAIGNQAVYLMMMQRAQSWQYLFNPATGYIEAKRGDGTFPTGAAFQSDLLEPGGQRGFEEGNAVQYTWSVPQNLSSLGNLMGGARSAVAKLDTFFTRLNATRFQPYDWAGNEPSLWTPWEFDFFGAPWRTQDVVRRIVTTLYADAPVDEPGNDDLGAMSSWYVWAALGLYPVTPATADLALASPLFPETSFELPSGRRLELSAPRAAPTTPYVGSLTVGGTEAAVTSAAATSACTSDASDQESADRAGAGTTAAAWNSPWLPAAVLTTGATLDYDLVSKPNRAWGSDLRNAPPSYTTGQLPAVGFSLPSGGVTVRERRSATIELGLQRVSADSPAVSWSASTTKGITVTPASGSLGESHLPASSSLGAGAPTTPDSCRSPAPLRQPLSLRADVIGGGAVTIHLRTTAGVELPDVVVDVTSDKPPS